MFLHWLNPAITWIVIVLLPLLKVEENCRYCRCLRCWLPEGNWSNLYYYLWIQRQQTFQAGSIVRRRRLSQNDGFRCILLCRCRYILWESRILIISLLFTVMLGMALMVTKEIKKLSLCVQLHNKTILNPIGRKNTRKPTWKFLNVSKLLIWKSSTTAWSFKMPQFSSAIFYCSVNPQYSASSFAEYWGKLLKKINNKSKVLIQSIWKLAFRIKIRTSRLCCVFW